MGPTTTLCSQVGLVYQNHKELGSITPPSSLLLSGRERREALALPHGRNETKLLQHRHGIVVNVLTDDFSIADLKDTAAAQF